MNKDLKPRVQIGVVVTSCFIAKLPISFKVDKSWRHPQLPNVRELSTATRSRCYDHNFLRFFANFRRKNGVFIKKIYALNFAKTSSILSKKSQFLRYMYFMAKIFFWIMTSTPVFERCPNYDKNVKIGSQKIPRRTSKLRDWTSHRKRVELWYIHDTRRTLTNQNRVNFYWPVCVLLLSTYVGKSIKTGHTLLQVDIDNKKSHDAK
jgi:hypothetical protein